MKAPFEGLARKTVQEGHKRPREFELTSKLAIPLIFFTGIGWLLVVIGFGIATVEEDREQNDPDTYHLWMVSFCGPVIIITAVFHAALWHPISLVFGVITSILSVFFLTALGMILYVDGDSIRTAVTPKSTALQFAGAFCAAFFWTLVMTMWLFYNGFSVPSSKDQDPFKGLAKKLVLPFFILTGVGWLLVVIGFAIGSNQNSPLLSHTREDPTSYLYWAVCISWPTTVATAVWRPISPIVGAFAVFVNTFFLTSLGMVLYINGQFIRTNSSDIDIPNYIIVEFAGAVLATLLWIPVMILWQFYDEVKSKNRGLTETA